MPSRSRRRRTNETSLRADAITSQSLTHTLFSPPPSLTRIEDRRTYHPLDIFRPARLLSGHPHTPVVVKKVAKFKRQLPFGLKFAQPKKTVMCIRRKVRKEVLHAFKKTGKGKGARRRPRKNWYSKIGC